MATPNSRTPLAGTASRRTPNENSPSRPTVASSVPASTGTGLARTPSLRQARPLRKTPTRTSISLASGDHELEDEEARSKNSELVKEIQDLRDRFERAEQVSQQYKNQLEAMRQDLDKASHDQTIAEERDFQSRTQVDQLRAEINDLKRENRELERQRAEDERLFQQERDKHTMKEAQQQATINRLNEVLRLNGIERSNANRSGGATEAQFPKEDVVAENATQRGNAPNVMHVLQQKEDTINALQIDLAEAQLRLAQQEHLQDARRLDLENKVSEYQRLNAKLREENESYEMLLSEKTLKGEFMRHDHNQDEARGMSSLAEELESTEETEDDIADGQTEGYKKLDADNKSLKAEIEALRLYIDKIIGRLLSHEGFEHIIQDKDDPPPPPAKPMAEKALPAIPDQQAAAPPTTIAGAATGFLQRARSVVQRPGGKARPMSYIHPTAAGPSANENPDTAPSIPLNRGHRRARSDQAQTDAAAAAVVQQMTRGSPMRTVSGSPLSPGIRPLSPPLSQGQGSYFGAATSTTTRTPSTSGNRVSSSANSVMSDSHSDEQKSNTDGSSIAPQVGGERQSQSNIPGAVMKQNQLRPLRLVQEQTVPDDEVAKRTNRGSIFGWFRGSTIETQEE
ncbi:hypothetical protein G647_00412 [Cladophialophora carrionii CBS 160.54]|uniref:M protein, serotype 2.1 n=1 Tax=Cladophialophora carrionii CBS 160.54 TaxID=1279043 RepID=V9DNT5_9EURO|nr:uncharacterized protein G647_00412 [Cladophialophora carrionii CBS 160.54]ETI27963.1 hypothetical protein G647_00412 [Cladophialophora carrionii CBS 160.54]